MMLQIAMIYRSSQREHYLDFRQLLAFWLPLQQNGKSNLKAPSMLKYLHLLKKTMKMTKTMISRSQWVSYQNIVSK